MSLFYKIISLAFFLHISTISATEHGCPCFTATTYVLDNGCPAYEPTPPCINPKCISISTTTIPGPAKRCPKTPTLTSYLPCQTACPTGCGATSTSTFTASASCLPQPPITTSSKRSCYTSTQTSTNTCETLSCLVPDWIYLSTTMVPGPVKGCTNMPTVTSWVPCKTTCPGCQTRWITVTASPLIA